MTSYSTTAPDLSWIDHKLVRSALKAWFNLQQLGAHPLAQLARGAAAQPTAAPTDRSTLRGRALRDLLAASLAELRPDSGPPQPSQPCWRAYLILTQLYTQARSTSELLDTLAISYPHFKREHARAIERLVAILRQRASRGATPAALDTALHQLRAPTVDFVGREAEIAQLVAALGSSAEQGNVAAIVGVRGLGGIGKTELAYAVAQRLAPTFADAQILVELHGASPRPLTPAQALEAAIRAFDSSSKLPGELGQLQALYRSLLAGKRVLIVADDARDAAQVRPLLPPSGSALLVTSRQRFVLPGQVALDLETLPPQAAEQLLLSRCPRLGNAAAVLAQQCGYLPLALRVSASLLASDATRGVECYLEVLADQQARLGQLRDPDDTALDVEAAIELSYRALDGAAQAVLCQLSVFPASFDRAAAAAVLDVSEAPDADQQLETPLGQLYRRCLLEWDAVSARYRLHDLVRAFAAAQLAPILRPAVQQRHATYYQGLLAEAGARYLAGGQAGPEGLDVVDREWDNLLAGQAWAAAHASDDGVAAALCSAYARGGANVLALRLHPHEQIAWHDAGLEAARRVPDQAAELCHLHHLGVAYAQLSDFQRSNAHHKQALRIARDLGDRHSESTALCQLGSNYDSIGALRQALGYHEQALLLARGVGYRLGEGRALHGLGNAYFEMGDFPRSRGLYEQALALYRAIGYRRGECYLLGNLGLLHRDLGDPQRGVEYLEQLWALIQATGDRCERARTLLHLGETYSGLGEPWRALHYLDEALGLYRTLGQRDGEARVLDCLGQVYHHLDELPRAIECHEQALTLAREVGDRSGEGSVLANLASAYAACGALGGAYDYYSQALTLASEIGNRELEAIANWRFGRLLEQQGELGRAVAMMQAAVEWERAVGHAKAEAHAAELEQLQQRLKAGMSLYRTILSGIESIPLPPSAC